MRRVETLAAKLVGLPHIPRMGQKFKLRTVSQQGLIVDYDWTAAHGDACTHDVHLSGSKSRGVDNAIRIDQCEESEYSVGFSHFSACLQSR